TRNRKVHRSERSEADLPDVGRGTVRHMLTPRWQMRLAGPITPFPPLRGPLDHGQELRSGCRARSGEHRRRRRWLRRAGDKWDGAGIVVLNPSLLVSPPLTRRGPRETDSSSATIVPGSHTFGARR